MYKLKFNTIFFHWYAENRLHETWMHLEAFVENWTPNQSKENLHFVRWCNVRRLLIIYTLIFGCDKESCTTCTHSKATYTETYWTHEYVTSRDYPKCKQVECWITVVKWIWRWRSGIWPVFTIHPNVSSNKPCKQKQIQDTIYKLCGHGLIFINVSIVFVSSCSLAKHYNGF